MFTPRSRPGQDQVSLQVVDVGVGRRRPRAFGQARETGAASRGGSCSWKSSGSKPRRRPGAASARLQDRRPVAAACRERAGRRRKHGSQADRAPSWPSSSGGTFRSSWTRPRRKAAMPAHGRTPPRRGTSGGSGQRRAIRCPLAQTARWRVASAAATGPLPVVSASRVRSCRQTKMAVGGGDEVDLAGGAGRQRRLEIGAQEGRVVPPAAQLMPFQAWRRAPHAATRRPLAASNTSVEAERERHLSPTPNRAVAPASSACTGPRAVLRW